MHAAKHISTPVPPSVPHLWTSHHSTQSASALLDARFLSMEIALNNGCLTISIAAAVVIVVTAVSEASLCFAESFQSDA